MAGMELPLLSPATPDTQPAPVVRPQNEGFTHIAEAGGSLQNDAYQLWRMNYMARQDEQAAALTRSSDQMQAASYALRKQAVTNNIPAEQQPKFYKEGLMQEAAKDLARYPDGPPKDRAKAMWEGEAVKGGQEMAYHATVDHLNQAEQAVKQALRDKANLIPFMPPEAQGRMQAEGHAFIDQYVTNRHLPSEAADDMHARYTASIALGHLQKAISDAPGHTLGELTSQDFDARNPWIGLVGGEAKRQQLINQAQASIKNSDAVANGRISEARSQQLNQLFAMHDKGQTPSYETLDGMTLLSAPVKEMFNRTWRPKPPGDRGALQALMGQVPHVTDPVDALNIKMKGVGILNPDQSKMLGDALDAQVKMSNTALGQANAASLREIDDHFNPIPKSPWQMSSKKMEYNKEISTRAQKDYIDAMKGLDASRAAEIKQRIIDQYDKRNEKKLQTDVAKPPTIDPASAKTMSDADLVARLRLH